MTVRNYSILDDAKSHNPIWLWLGKRAFWLSGIGLWVLAYFWFSWWGIALSLGSFMLGSCMMAFSSHELIWKERDRIRPKD